MISTMTAEEREQIIALYNSGLDTSLIYVNQKVWNLCEVQPEEERDQDSYQKQANTASMHWSKLLWCTWFWRESITGGFFYAGSYNNELRGELKLCLSKDDAHHIQKFQAAIGRTIHWKKMPAINVTTQFRSSFATATFLLLLASWVAYRISP